MTRESDIYINTSEVLSREEKDRILKSIFSAGRTPEAYFLYQGKGAELYEAVVNDPNYVYYQRGKNLITDNREALQKFIGKNVVDHGSGTGEKADLLLRNLHKPLHYIAQDYSYEMTELARDTVAEHNSFVNTGEGVIIKGKGSANNLTQGLEDATFLWLGGTIGNFSPEEDVKTLREMGNTSYLKGNYVIFDAFTAPSAEELEQELLPAYNSASQRAWLENGLEILGLQKEDFEVQIDYIKDPEDWVIEDGKRVFPWMIRAWYIAKRDVEIPLSEGKNLSVKAGQFFLLNTSRRDTKAQIKQMIKDSGAKQVFSATAKESGMAIMVAHRPPSKLTQNKVKIRNALFVTLAFSAGVWGKWAFDAKQQQDRIQQAEEWFFEGKKGMTERNDYSLTSPENREMFKHTVEYIYSYLSTMYHLPSAHADEVKLLLLQYLWRTKDASEYMVSTDVAMPWSEVSIYGFLQQFIKDNALLLANYGVDTRNPYPQLAEFSSNFQSTLEVKDKWSGYFPMVDGRLTAINQEKIHIDGMGLLSDDPTSHPQRVHYGGYVEDPNALYVKGTLGKYKSSQHGITYWTLITVDKAGKKYLLATQAIGEMPTSPNFTIEAGQRVIEDYLAHFWGGNDENSDQKPFLAVN